MSKSLLARGLNKLKRKQNQDRRKAARSMYRQFLQTLPVDPDLTILEARNGRAIDGNIFYLLEVLATSDAYRHLKLVTVAEDAQAEQTIRRKIASFDSGRVDIVRLHSEEYYRVMASAGFIVNDATIANFFIKRPEQIYLNVWHGTPLKTMGRKVSHEPHATGNVQKNFIIADYLLYPSEYMMEHMVEDYMLENLSGATVLLGGYPRNTAFFDDGTREELRRTLAPEASRIYAYMPTWRPALMGEALQQILEEIDGNLADDEVMFVNVHPLAEETVEFDGFHSIRRFPREYENYRVLNASDALLTDYSSVFYDYAVSGRKIVLLTYDEKEYFSTRGLYEPISSLPFPQVSAVRDALDALRAPKEYDDKAFLEKYCSYEKPQAAEELCRRVFLGESCMEEREIPDNGLPNVLVYGGDLAEGERTDRTMAFLADPGKPAANYYLTFNRKDLKERYGILFELPEGISYIGRAGTMWLDPAAQEISDRYKKGKVSFEEYWKAVRPAFALERKRYYGDMRIEKIIQIPEGRQPGPGVSAEELEFSAYDL